MSFPGLTGLFNILIYLDFIVKIFIHFNSLVKLKKFIMKSINFDEIHYEFNDECQRLGCHFDDETDLFGHFSHHRNLLLDQLPKNIEHEIEQNGREIIKDLGYPIQFDLSQQNIVPDTASAYNGTFKYPYQQDKFGSILSNIDCISTSFFLKNIERQIRTSFEFHSTYLRGGMSGDDFLSHGNNVNNHYIGLRLTNFRNDCYLNCAINNLLGIPAIKEAILNMSSNIKASERVVQRTVGSRCHCLKQYFSSAKVVHQWSYNSI